MKKEIWLIISVSKCILFDDSEITKDVIFAEASEENALKTIEKFDKRAQNEKNALYEVYYIYQKINLYE